MSITHKAASILKYLRLFPVVTDCMKLESNMWEWVQLS